MPAYEYECRKCGAKSDVFATIAQKEAGLKPVCPICGSKKMKQVFGFNILGASRPLGGFSGCGPGAGSGCCG